VAEYDYVDTGQIRLAYRVIEAGPPSGGAEATPMVLLHGGGGDGTTFDPLTPAFATRRTVYLPELRGMGHSERLGPYSLRILRDDISRFLDILGLNRVTLLGHSLGAFVALLVAEQTPDRVAALILEECPPPVPLKLPIPASLPDDAPYYDREVRPSVLAELNTSDPAWWEAVSTLRVPTLVLAGGPTSFLPQDVMAEFADRLPAGRLSTIPAGHHIHMTEPAAFVEAVESFLDGVTEP
jgi:3-oxoadipate enol-lactonase